jgi:hypothetical protein
MTGAACVKGPSSKIYAATVAISIHFRQNNSKQGPENILLDGVSLMPKRSINNTDPKVYKSDTTVKGNLSCDTSQQLIPVSFRLAHFHCEPRIPFVCVMIRTTTSIQHNNK